MIHPCVGVGSLCFLHHIEGCGCALQSHSLLDRLGNGFQVVACLHVYIVLRDLVGAGEGCLNAFLGGLPFQVGVEGIQHADLLQHDGCLTCAHARLLRRVVDQAAGLHSFISSEQCLLDLGLVHTCFDGCIDALGCDTHALDRVDHLRTHPREPHPTPPTLTPELFHGDGKALLPFHLLEHGR